jgi:hypothetical protein
VALVGDAAAGFLPPAGVGAGMAMDSATSGGWLRGRSGPTPAASGEAPGWGFRKVAGLPTVTAEEEPPMPTARLDPRFSYPGAGLVAWEPVQHVLAEAAP